MERGYVQVYTGDGKGKTTAALGLAFRALGHGLKVIMFQFIKGTFSGELATAKNLSPRFQICRAAAAAKFVWQLNEEERLALKREVIHSFRQAQQAVQSGDWDIVILDEVMAAIGHGFLEEEEVCRLLEEKPHRVELVLTGRKAPSGILERADLVTEMRPLKHYYDQGVGAREGIER